MGAGYTAVPTTWQVSGQGMIDASDRMALAVDGLCRQLGAAGACWGNDDIGRAFFNGDEQNAGFGASRDAVLVDLADMVNLVRNTGGMLSVSARNYSVAEDASTIGAQPAGADHNALATLNPYRLPSVTAGLATSDPEPSGLVWILRLMETLVGGCEWPDGDLAGLAAMRDAFTSAAASIGAVAEEVGVHVQAVTAHNAGSATESFAAFTEALYGGGDGGGLRWLVSALTGLGDWVGGLIKEKNAARLQFELSCGFLIGMWRVAMAASEVTLGGSVAGAVSATEAEATVLRALLLRIARSVVKSVAMGAVFGAGMDTAGQFARIHEGLQNGYNWGELAKASGEGAIAGLVMGGAGVWVSRSGGRFATALASSMEAGGFKGAASRFVFAGTSGTAGNVASQALVEHHVDLAQAAEFGFGMAGIEGFKGAGRTLLSRFGGNRYTAHGTPHGDADPYVILAARAARP